VFVEIQQLQRICVETLPDIPTAADLSAETASCHHTAGWSPTNHRRETVSTHETRGMGVVLFALLHIHPLDLLNSSCHFCFVTVDWASE